MVSLMEFNDYIMGLISALLFVIKAQTTSESHQTSTPDLTAVRYLNVSAIII